MHDKRVALVTGGNQGVGLNVVQHLAAAGYTVLLGSRMLARGTEAARGVTGDVRAIQLDVTDRGSIAAAASRIRTELGRLDLLVNNAAISNTRKTQLGLTLAESAAISRASVVSIDEVRAIWDTNVFGVLAVYQAMLPLLREAPYARIVNVSSGVGSTRASRTGRCTRPAMRPRRPRSTASRWR
jgi:NAD(P)-dependent dehydrogenase (short-subunit alcohol dehydrogenase family)